MDQKRRQHVGVRIVAVVCGGAMVALVALSAERDGVPAWPVLLGASAGFWLGHQARIHLPGRLNLSLDLQEAALIGAALLLPAGHVFIAAVAGNLVAAVRSRELSVTVLGATFPVLGVVTATAAVARIASSTPNVSWLIAAVVGAVVYVTTTWAAMRLIVVIALDRQVSGSPVQDWAWSFPMAIPAACLGALIAAASTAGGWTWIPVAAVGASLLAATHIARDASKEGRRALTLVHLQALVMASSNRDDILDRSCSLLAGTFDGYEVVIADGAEVDDAEWVIDVQDGLRLTVRKLAHPPALTRHEITFLDDVATILRDGLSAVQERDVLERAASTDPLTGLMNRRALDAIAADRRRFGVVLLDVNNLKALNDIVGHAAGDALLCDVGEVLRATIRAGDIAARLGGDEFVVVTDGSVALSQFVDRLDAALSELRTPPELHVGVSIGTATTGVDGTTFDELLAAADARLYSAKRHVVRPAGYTRTAASD